MTGSVSCNFNARSLVPVSVARMIPMSLNPLRTSYCAGLAALLVITGCESLQTATSNPAKFLGMQAGLGTIESGKIADLLLLTANPLEDIRNTRKISAVLAAGRLFDRAALDQMLTQVETAAKKQK